MPLPALTCDDLSGCELFRGLDRAGLAAAFAAARIHPAARNTTLFHQGDPAGRAHVLMAGRVRITLSDADGSQLLVRFIGPGETFGTVGLFTDDTYPAQAVVVTDCVEASWSKPDLLALIAAHPGIAINLVRITGLRLREAQERLAELATLRAERRIAHVLLRLAGQAGQPAGGGTAINFPLSRRDVADMCGTTLHTVSRTLTAWEKAGLLTTSQQHITILDLQEIRRRAEDL